MYFDSDGGIVQQNGDAGDRPARTGLYHLLIWWRRKIMWLGEEPGQYPFSQPADFVNFTLHCKDLDGNYFRGGEWKDPKDMSRDQFFGLLAAMSVYGMRDEMKRIIMQFLHNYSRAPNGDPIGPQMWAMIFRGMGWWWLYPLTVLFDVEHFLNTLLLCLVKAREPGKIQKWLGSHAHWIFIAGEQPASDGRINDAYGPDNVGGDINHLKPWMIGKLWQKSPVLWFSWWLYIKMRPSGAQYAWDRYFRPETGANPFNELVKPILNQNA